MEVKKSKKGLHIKVALITLVGILVPLLLSIFFIQNQIASIVLGILVSMVSIFILFKFLKPLDTLIKGAESLAAGNFNSLVDIRSNDELEEVGNSFNTMSSQLKKSMETLSQDKDVFSAEKNQLSMIISSMLDGIIALDLSKNIVLINKAGQELTGYAQEEIQGKPIDQFIHLFSETEELPSKSYCQINLGQSLKLVGKDGKDTKVNLIASPITEGIQTNLSCILILHDLAHEQELEQMKLDFVSMASHELKTPLTNIIGYLSVFIDENKDKISKEEIELLERSLISSKQLFSLVENLLNVNKIERDQLSVSIEVLDLTPILTKAVEDLQTQAKQKNITLTYNPQVLPKVLADPIRIGEVITNLVSNAINYTNTLGAISVTTQVNPTEVMTTISDTGMGIPDEAIPHLFNKFFRVSNMQQQANKGTGLGLYISKSIINKLNGRIWVESEVGKGSKFHFTLPLAPQANLGSIDTNQFVGESIQSGALNY